MDDIFIVGIGMTPFRRQADRSVKDLVASVVEEALKDADTDATAVDTVAFANTMQGALEGQHAVAGQMALRGLGFGGKPVLNVENACASGSSALHVAVNQLRAGVGDVALAVGVERMSHDKAGATEWFKGAWDVYESDRNVESLLRIGSGVPTPSDVEEPDPGRKSQFMDVYAALMKHHMATYGVTERQLAAVASKDHWHSTMNPLAQYQRAFTVEEVLAAPMISWPITLPMCSPHTDGAAAAIVCTRAGLARLGRSRAVRVAASVVGTGVPRDSADLDQHVARLAALRAYEIAGVGPEAMDLAEVHDATSFGEILQVENLGLVERGDGGPASERGETTLGGRLPVNTSGGLVSKGHPIAATGLGQIHEMVTQLRGEAGARQVPGDPTWAVSQNGGGFTDIEDAVEVVTVLTRDR
ncbi:thiolase family protein [Pseudonocardia kongjuensis]|uniref:propanoyl-CoA C-acyltransferase n=1 Tax=Pseudonocardia kongjuensis TaxID=102227 RepID=A0ABN1XPV5_9PSEU